MSNSTAPSLGGKNLRPCLAELLRTCVHPPSLLLKVEHVFRPAKSDRSDGTATLTSVQARTSQHDHDIDVEPRQSTPQSMRLALSDGQLQIQAVLATRLHTKELLELRKGDLLELKKFHVRTAPRVNGHGRVIYLGVDACEWVGAIGTVREIDENLGGGFIPDEDDDQVLEKESFPSSRTFLGRVSDTDSTMQGRSDDEATSTANQHASEPRTETTMPRNMERKRSRDPPNHPSNLSSRKTLSSEHPSSKSRSTPRPTVRFATPSPDSSDSSDTDDFETILTSPSTVQLRRESLRNAGQITQGRTGPAKKPHFYSRISNKTDVVNDMSTESQKMTTSATGNAFETDIKLASSSILHSEHNDAAEVESSSVAKASSPPRTTDPHPQPGPRSQALTSLPSTAPLHTLSTLLHSPTFPRRNYTCSALGVITWVSPSLIHKPNSPFPPKRHIKIHDPSISSRRVGVTIAIYVDARDFMPEVGTVALFRGVTMQRWEGEVILNAYANLKDLAEKWFVTGDEALEQMGCNVVGLKRWWAEWAHRKGPGSPQ